MSLVERIGELRELAARDGRTTLLQLGMLAVLEELAEELAALRDAVARLEGR